MHAAQSVNVVTTCSAWLRDIAHFSEESPNRGEPPFAVGDRLLSRFEIQRLVGRGGMGFVYEAFDENLRMSCALKTLTVLRPERVLLLKNEFRALADIYHPNLVRPGELMRAQQRWFFTMELVRGGDPSSWVGRDSDRLWHVLRELASVLVAMHEQHLVHRDVKLSNVIVAAPKRVVLLDLGLARHTDRPLWFDRASAGTPLYMPPESPPFGPPADWYAFGMLLYELATGHCPFEGTGDRLVAQKRNPRCIPSLTQSRPDLSPDLDRLFRDLLAVEPEARPNGHDVLCRLRASGFFPRRRRVVSHSSPLIGRNSELERLRTAFSRIEAGQSAAVFVHGPSGIGKTALVDAFVSEVSQTGVIVFAGRCRERESVAFKTLDGVVDAIAALISRYPPAERHEIVPKAAAPLNRVFPALHALDGLVEAAPQANGAERDDVFHALRALLRALTQRSRVVLIVDDLQWADADGLALLGHALAPPDAPALMLIACSRNPERPEALASLAGQISLSVEPLSHSDAEALARAHATDLTDAAHIARLVREAGGHPLFVQELARLSTSAADAGPAGLDAVIRARVRALEEPTRGLLELLVVAGGPVSKRALGLSSGHPPEALERELRILEGEQFSRACLDTSLIDVFHDRVREAVLHQLAIETLTEHHERWAKAYEQSSPLDTARLAVHWAGAGDKSRAFRHARAAANQALDGLAFAHAAELYALALRLDFPADRNELQELRVRLAHALVQAWRPLEAADAFVKAAASAEGKESRSLRIRAVEQLLLGGDLDRGLAELASALRQRGMSTPRSLPARLLAAFLARAKLYVVQHVPSSIFTQRRRFPEDIDALLGAVQALAMLDALLALGYHAQALVMVLRIDDPQRLVQALAQESMIQAGTGSFSKAAQRIDEIEHHLARNPSPANQVWRNAARFNFLVQLGRWHEALAMVELNAPARRERNAWVLVSRELHMALCEYNLGRFLELSERCERARRDASQRDHRFLELAFGVSVFPFVHLLRDEVDEARALVDEIGKRIWRGGGGGYFHALHAVSALLVELYDQAHGAHEPRQLAPFAAALAKRTHYGRVYLLYLDGSSALRAMRTSGKTSFSLKRRVRAAIRNLRRDPVPWAEPYGVVLSASLAHLERRHRACLDLLRSARAGFARFGSAHMVDIVDRACLLCEAPERAREAEARLRVRGVVRPARFAAMLAPAFV
jgi:hypothetical protein